MSVAPVGERACGSGDRHWAEGMTAASRSEFAQFRAVAP